LIIGNRCKLKVFIVILTLFVVSFLPSAVNGSYPGSNELTKEESIDSDLFDLFDEYLTLINYNEPMNPYILLNYHYKDGSCARLVYGIRIVNLVSDNQNHDSEFIPILNDENNIVGWGLKTNANSNLFLFTKRI
jgi:hypothetical protein